ncbi:hypothetical protein JL857_20700 [Vibrio parahaemolyticus]|uniref:Uncharacterized protein n=1 Tax=Vibrio parahaemolyticus TaxID=670 RepID=A0A9Q3YKX6_VIBPH|nr:hypothetical protein [Vibrio parahaemolyticus]MCC3807508.1 hypothetical protein [Vibrio parahaemolyticus]MCI9696475.1 hypothetical protein [Vibrio parahaemolyticus]MCI9711061.1 hypothetical protein [Vibrio parahaemolyticus]MCI9715941.1 hypothetical protein [Vibrio parahaemolyticus]
MKCSKYQHCNAVSNGSFTELLVVLSLFIAMCGIQLTHELDAFNVVHFIVAALFTIPLYLLRWRVYKKRPQPPSIFIVIALALAIAMLVLIEARTPLSLINTLCFALLMMATITPPHHITTDDQDRDF